MILSQKSVLVVLKLLKIPCETLTFKILNIKEKFEANQEPSVERVCIEPKESRELRKQFVPPVLKLKQFHLFRLC